MLLQTQNSAQSEQKESYFVFCGGVNKTLILILTLGLLSCVDTFVSHYIISNSL